MKRIYDAVLGYTLLLYGVLFCVIVLAAYTNYRIVADHTQEDVAGAGLVNEAGRQRMLSQRLAKEVLLGFHATDAPTRQRLFATADATVHELLAGHEGLRAHTEGRDPEIKDLPASPVALASRLMAIDRLLDETVQGQAVSRESAQALVDVTLTETDAYLATMEKIVAHVANAHLRYLRRLQLQTFLVAGPVLAILLVVTLVFFRPLVRRLKASHVEVEDANARLRREAQERTAAEARAAAILAAAADVVATVGETGRIEQVSEPVRTMFGHSPAALIGQHITCLVVPGQHERFRAAFQHLLQTGSLPGEADTVEMTGIASDGRRIPLEATVRRFRLGERTLVTGFLRDVSQRKRHERERLGLAKVVEQVSEAILICGRDGRIEYVNPAFERITGYGLADVVGKTPRVLASGTTGQAVYRQLWQTISAGRPWQGRLTDRKRDGALFEVQQSITPIFEGSTPVNFVGVMRDVTHEVELEAKLRQSQKLEAIGSLAGGIAHEFNNILTPIVGYTELALSRLAPDSREQAGLQRVLAGAQRASELVRQILAFSRQGDQGRHPLRLEQVVDDVVQLLRSTLPGNVQVATRIAADLPGLQANATQLRTAVVNLCINAAQAMPKGGQITLELELAETGEAPGLSPLAPGSAPLRLTVRDTGVGMDAATRQRVFDPFFSTKEVGQGTGLGLSTVYGIVMQLGGVVEVDSTPGQGSEFRIYLPTRRHGSQTADLDADPPPPEAGAEPAPAQRLAPAPARILIVDDEPPVRELAAEALAAEGHQVTAAASAEQALARIEASVLPFDLVITDQLMPGMSGQELLAELRARQLRMPVIFTSGRDLEVGNGNGATPAHAAASQRFLAKPYSIADLCRTVQDALRESRG